MVTSITAPGKPQALSREEYLLNPPDQAEWVNGFLVEKNGMTLKTSRVQSKLDTLWRNYKDQQNLGGEVYTEPPCRALEQVRRPDVAYLTPDLLAQFGELNVLPQSFPLVAEIVSPTDYAEDVFSKANEYLESGCLEVWLLFPESEWIIVMTQSERSLFTKREMATSPIVLPGLRIAVDSLIS